MPKYRVHIKQSWAKDVQFEVWADDVAKAKKAIAFEGPSFVSDYFFDDGEEITNVEQIEDDPPKEPQIDISKIQDDPNDNF